MVDWKHGKFLSLHVGCGDRTQKISLGALKILDLQLGETERFKIERIIHDKFTVVDRDIAVEEL